MSATAKKPKTAITPTREENYPEWYQQVVKAADLAESSDVRGCMVIKPWGYALWENMQQTLDGMFKATGHRNAYFPLFIPLSFLEKEAEHVEGFAKECAVVTHHRLVESSDGGLVPDPDSKLEEPLIVRPTSETIIGATFARWVESYRDLPLLINQWANVVRWEMRTRLFLRTAEFLWQEGHTVHATEQEARDETQQMLEVYATFARDWMAIPVITGRKTDSEKFPGADETYTIEAMMQDRKALQCGTSHFLGQNFAKASEIKYLSEEGKLEYAWTTSWGMTTRMIGAMVMVHSDDDGLRLPPRLAPAQVVILPITMKADDPQEVHQYCETLAAELRKIDYHGRKVEVEIDARDIRGGEKNWQWVKRGVPIRLEVGPRDMADDSVFMARRDKGHKDKQSMKRADFAASITAILDEIQATLLRDAMAFRDAQVEVIDDQDAFEQFFETPRMKDPNAPTPIHAGFVLAHWNGDAAIEAKINQQLGVTIRCVPTPGQLDAADEPGECIFTGEPSAQRVLWAKSY